MKELLALVAQVTNRPESSLRAESSLSQIGLSSSLGLNILRSALERKFGRKLPILTWSMTLMDVQKLLDGETPVPDAVAPTTRVSSATAKTISGAKPALPWEDIGLGVDLEDIASMPGRDCLRSDPFYAATFAERELSTALLRPDPVAHLCGLFCAKEALKKSHPDLLNLRLREIVIAHTDAGAPYVVSDDLNSHFEFKVSISHGKTFATAVVLSRRTSG